MGKYASIDMTKIKGAVRDGDLKDPYVMVHGYGSMKLSQLKKITKEQTDYFSKLIKDEDYERASYLTFENNGNLILFVRALDNIVQDIKKLSTLIR